MTLYDLKFRAVRPAGDKAADAVRLITAGLETVFLVKLCITVDAVNELTMSHLPPLIDLGFIAGLSVCGQAVRTCSHRARPAAKGLGHIHAAGRECLVVCVDFSASATNQAARA